MSYFNPVFLYDEKTHKPAQEGDQLTPASVPVSKAEGNVLKTSDDGLGVSVNDIKSPASDNAIKIASDGGLFVDTPVIPEVSKDRFNYLRYGNDGNFFVGSSDVLSNLDTNLLHASSDGRVILTASDLVDGSVLAKFISSEKDNVLHTGSDGKLAVTRVGISAETGNYLTYGSDGKYYVSGRNILSTSDTNILHTNSESKITLTAGDVASSGVAPLLVSSDDGNGLDIGSDGKLAVTLPKEATVSADKGNYTRKGSDGGFYTGGNDVLSNADENILHISPVDDRVILTKEDLLHLGLAAALLSKDANNAIVLGSDRGLYTSGSNLTDDSRDNLLDVTDKGKISLDKSVLRDYVNSFIRVVSTDSGNLITAGSDGGAYASADSLRSTDSLNLISKDSSGKLIVTAGAIRSDDADNLLVQDKSGALKVTAEGLVSSEKCNLLRVNTDDKLSLCPSDLISQVPNNALQAAFDGGLYVAKNSASDLVSPTDKILYVNDSGKLASGFTLSFNEATGTLTVVGHNNQVVTSVAIPSGEGAILKDAQLVTNPEGHAEGTYLKFTFTLSDGSTKDTYVNVDALRVNYTGGNGITVSGTTVSTRIKDKGGLTYSDGALAVDTASLVSTLSDNTIKTDSSGDIYLSVDAFNVSTQAGNALANGVDGKAYFPYDFGTMD